jgi:hypothetical protein
MKVYKKYKRVWLNPPSMGDSGAYSHKIEVEKYKEHINIEATISLWDCSRKIVLDFSVWNKGDKKQRLKKIDVLIQHLSEFRDQLDEACNYLDGDNT